MCHSSQVRETASASWQLSCNDQLSGNTMALLNILLGVGLLLAGTMSTLAAQGANALESMGNDGNVKKFRHPFMQAWGMFLGEIFCMGVFLIERNVRAFSRLKREKMGLPISKDDKVLDAQQFNPFIFSIPAILDATASCISYFGLTMTYAASYQLLRGSSIIFTAILARYFLGRIPSNNQIIGIIIVVAGLVTVGATDLISANERADRFKTNSGSKNAEDELTLIDVLLGNVLIILAQFLFSIQLTYEEKFITKYKVPVLHVLGLEGIFGFHFMSVLLLIMYFIPVGERFGKNPRAVIEDALDGFYQMRNNPLIAMAFVGTFMSVALYYYVALSITQVSKTLHHFAGFIFHL